MVSYEDVRSQTVVHEVPGHLKELFVFVRIEKLEVHYYQLVRVLDVDAEAEVLQNFPLLLNDFLLQRNIVLVQDNGFDGSPISHLFDVVEHVDYISGSARMFLNLTGKTNAAHGSLLHIILHERFRVEISVEQHASRGHRNLRQLQQFPGSLDEVAAEIAEVVFHSLGHPVTRGRGRGEFLHRQH